MLVLFHKTSLLKNVLIIIVMLIAIFFFNSANFFQKTHYH
ncbi:hypothetical protein BCAH1134_C0665 (plasmid) [Bacillus cereus AH1134]|nr:hypothetical protein BCAH1134_C0665 [Bacillus cereus AH1134]